MRALAKMQVDAGEIVETKLPTFATEAEARYATFDAAQEHADALNALIGHGDDTAFRIVASAMGGRRFYTAA